MRIYNVFVFTTGLAPLSSVPRQGFHFLRIGPESDEEKTRSLRAQIAKIKGIVNRVPEAEAAVTKGLFREGTFRNG